MTIAIESAAQAPMVNLKRQISSTNAAPTETEVLALVDTGHKNLLRDFSVLDSISSAGLHLVLVVGKRLGCAMQPHAKSLTSAAFCSSPTSPTPAAKRWHTSEPGAHLQHTSAPGHG